MRTSLRVSCWPSTRKFTVDICPNRYTTVSSRSPCSLGSGPTPWETGWRSEGRPSFAAVSAGSLDQKVGIDTMNILAIESSCDDTAAAVVKDGRTVLSSCVSSQIEMHTIYGGVVDVYKRQIPLSALMAPSTPQMARFSLTVSLPPAASLSKGRWTRSGSPAAPQRPVKQSGPTKVPPPTSPTSRLASGSSPMWRR